MNQYLKINEKVKQANGKSKSFKLESKVKAFEGEKALGDYTVSILVSSDFQKDSQAKTLLRITPDANTYGHWQWHLDSLMSVSKYGTGNGISDMLYLDYGQGWRVTGMKEVYHEIINKILVIGIFTLIEGG